MSVLWKNSPLTKSQIQDCGDFPRTSLYRALNSLLSKGYIHIAGDVLDKNVKSRLYEPSISEEELDVMLAKSSQVNKKSIPLIISALIEDTDDKELIEELEEIIRRKKDNL